MTTIKIFCSNELKHVFIIAKIKHMNADQKDLGSSMISIIQKITNNGKTKQN